MTGGNSPIGYLKAYHTNLYLSADPMKVREALEEGKWTESIVLLVTLLEKRCYLEPKRVLQLFP